MADKLDPTKCLKLTDEQVVEHFGEDALLNCIEMLDDPSAGVAEFFWVKGTLVAEAVVDGAAGPGVWDPEEKSWDWL